MRVQAIMLPREIIKAIPVGSTMGEALKAIEDSRLLSLPVIDGNKLVGMLSKRSIYELFFKGSCCDKEEFLAKPIRDYAFQEFQSSVTEQDSIDTATNIFTGSNIPFIPVVDNRNDLCGLVTYQAIFKEYQKIYGIGHHHTLLIHCLDYKGVLAQILDVIAKAGGSIKNIVLRDPEVIGVQQLYLKIEADDLDRVVKALENRSIDVRSVTPAG